VILTIERVPAGSPGRVIVLSEFIRRLCGRDLTARDVNSLLHLGGADREGNPASLESGILGDVTAAVRRASINPGWAPAMGADLPRMTLVCPVESCVLCGMAYSFMMEEKMKELKVLLTVPPGPPRQQIYYGAAYAKIVIALV